MQLNVDDENESCILCWKVANLKKQVEDLQESSGRCRKLAVEKNNGMNDVSWSPWSLLTDDLFLFSRDWGLTDFSCSTRFTFAVCFASRESGNARFAAWFITYLVKIHDIWW